MKRRQKIRIGIKKETKGRAWGEKKIEVGVTEDFQWANNLLSFRLTLEWDLALSLHENE